MTPEKGEHEAAERGGAEGEDCEPHLQTAVRRLLGITEGSIRIENGLDDASRAGVVVRVVLPVLASGAPASGLELALRIAPANAGPPRPWLTGPHLSLTYELLPGGRSPLDDAACQQTLLAVKARFEQSASSRESHAVLLWLRDTPKRTAQAASNRLARRGDTAEATQAPSEPRWRKVLGFYHECELSGAEEDTLYLAVQLGVPQFLAKRGAATASDIAAGVGGNEEMFPIFLQVLEDMGLCARSRDSGRYSLDPEFAPMEVILAALEARREMRDRLRGLIAGALRKGRLPGWMDIRETQAVLWPAAIRVAGVTQERRFSSLKRLVSKLELDQARLLLDVGAGSGHFTAAFLSVYPNLHVIAADYSHVLPEAEATVERFSVRGRVTLLDAPFLFSDWLPPSGCAAIWYANTMHVTGLEENRSLFHKFHEALEPNGKLLVAERVRAPGNLVNAMNELTWMLGSTGRAYDREDVVSLFRESGFSDLHGMEGDECLMIAGTKP